MSSSNDARGRAWSIAVRLAVSYAAATFVLVAMATGLLYWVLVANVDREDDQFLVDTIQIMRALIRERPADIDALRQEVDWEGTARRYARVYLRVVDEQGRLIIETPGATRIIGPHDVVAADASEEPGPGLEVTSTGTPYRLLAAWAPLGWDGRNQRLIQIAMDRTTERQLLREYRDRLWGVLVLALVASAVVGYTIARRGMAPVAAIGDTARRIGSSTLDARIPTDGLPGELSSLAGTFNDMLDRLEDAFTRLSSLSADLAHELRTPINNLRGEIEVALGKPRTAAEYEDTLASVLEESSRLSEMIDGLMFLARADNPETQIARTHVGDVRGELRAVCEFYEPAAAEAGVALRVVDDGESVAASFDRTLFQRALGNLILNAVTHTRAGGEVCLAAVRQDGAVRISVSDNGSGIPREHLARVSDRFYRVDASRSLSSGGLGLGLAIVGSIMRVHGGSMDIASAPDEGTTVTLVLPDVADRSIPSSTVSDAVPA